MAKIQLAKRGQRINLSKRITNALVGLGWKIKGDANVDLDVSVFLLDENQILQDGDDLIFYNHLEHSSGCVKHMGDNRDGGDGNNDDEQIHIDFTKIPDRIKFIKIVITIFKWKKKKQTFGSVASSYARLVETDSDYVPDDSATEYRFDLTEDASGASAMLMMTLTKKDGNWEFQPNGEGHTQGLGEFIRKYGQDYEGDD